MVRCGLTCNCSHSGKDGSGGKPSCRAVSIFQALFPPVKAFFANALNQVMWRWSSDAFALIRTDLSGTDISEVGEDLGGKRFKARTGQLESSVTRISVFLRAVVFLWICVNSLCELGARVFCFRLQTNSCWCVFIAACKLVTKFKWQTFWISRWAAFYELWIENDVLLYFLRYLRKFE